MPRDIKPAITLDALFPSLKGVKTHQVPLVADPALLGGPLFRPESRLRAGGTTETGGCHVEMGNVAQFYVTEGREAGECPSRPSSGIGPELPHPKIPVLRSKTLPAGRPSGANNPIHQAAPPSSPRPTAC